MILLSIMISEYFHSKCWELGAVIFSFSGQEYPEVPCTIVQPLFDIIVYDIIVYEYGHNCLWHNCLLCRRLEYKYINRRQRRILYEIINNFQLFWTNVPKVLSQESKKKFLLIVVYIPAWLKHILDLYYQKKPGLNEIIWWKPFLFCNIWWGVLVPGCHYVPSPCSK